MMYSTIIVIYTVLYFSRATCETIVKLNSMKRSETQSNAVELFCAKQHSW